MLTAYVATVLLGGTLSLLGCTVPAIICVIIGLVLVLRYELRKIGRHFANASKA